MSVTEQLVPVEVALDQLKANPRNPRRISDAALAKLARSIEAEPSMLSARPVVALPDGTIIAGNMRWKAAPLAGRDTIPVVYVDLDDTRAKQWMLRDNNEYGEWEDDLLAEILAELGDDLELTGFDEAYIAQLLAAHDSGDDDAGEPDREPTEGEKLAAMKVTLGPPAHETVRGEVWNVGAHHLVVVSVFSGWPVYAPLLGPNDLLVPYPTPILPLTTRAQEHRLVMVQPDLWLAGHLLDRYAEVHGVGEVSPA